MSSVNANNNPGSSILDSAWEVRKLNSGIPGFDLYKDPVKIENTFRWDEPSKFYDQTRDFQHNSKKDVLYKHVQVSTSLGTNAIDEALCGKEGIHNIFYN